MKISAYFKPKTLVYTGSFAHITTEIKHWQYKSDKFELVEGFEFDNDMKHYVQVVGLADVKKIQGIRENLAIDPLVMEDVFNVNQRNKFELKENYIFGTFSLSYLENDVIKNDYMSIIMFSNVIISFHETEPTYLRHLTPLFSEHRELRELPVDYLFFQIMDIITDEHLEVYDTLNLSVNDFEAQLLEKKSIEQEVFYNIRKQLLKLKNNVSPFAEQLEKVLSKKSDLFNTSTSIFFDDLKDHLQRLDNRLNQSREITRNLLDLHMNNQSTKMNKIMATLTVFSATFIPLSFLTGFFGMNFVHFGVLQYESAIFIFSGICVAIAIGMVVFFKKRSWL